MRSDTDTPATTTITAPTVQVPEDGMAPPPTKPMLRNLRVTLPILAVLAAVGVGGWYWYVGQRDFVSTDDAFIEGHRATISAKMLGRITALGADEGDTVRAGQVLATLDPQDLQAQEEQSRAALGLAEQNVALAATGIAKADEDFQRADVQYRDRIITKEQYDHAKQELDAARARKAVAVAQVASARAQMGVIRSQLGNVTIVAPMNGVVSKRWALTGDVVQPGQPIFSVYAANDVWVTANMEETSLTDIRTGDTVLIAVDAWPGTTFGGRVLEIGSNTAAQFSLIPPNNASGNFTKVTQRVPVKISISGPAGGNARLLPGMSVEVRVKVR